MRETVTEYKTVGEQKEVLRSDLSGDTLDESETVPLFVNPQMSSLTTPTTADMECDAEVHLSVGEVAELLDIDEDEIEVGEDLPQAYVNTAEPEVVKKESFFAKFAGEGCEIIVFCVSLLALVLSALSAHMVLENTTPFAFIFPISLAAFTAFLTLVMSVGVMATDEGW